MKKREFKISFFLHVWEKKAEEISLGKSFIMTSGEHAGSCLPVPAVDADGHDRGGQKAEKGAECGGSGRQVPGRTCGEPGDRAERTGAVRL